MLSRRRHPLLTIDIDRHRAVRPLSRRTERCSMLAELIEASAPPTPSRGPAFDIVISTVLRDGLTAAHHAATAEVSSTR